MEPAHTELGSRILFVDDDELVRNAFSRALQRRGYEVDTAKDAWSAMKLAKRVDYAVIATDYRMPGLSGIDTVDELRALQPYATFVLVSGNCTLDIAIQAVNEHGVTFVIKKPWSIEQLAETIQRGIEQAWERSLQKRVATNVATNAKRIEDRERRLHEVLASAKDDLAEALLSSLELRDYDSRQGCRRVAEGANILGKAMGLDGEVAGDLHRGALLHDIGKLGIPDAILLKPAALTPAEWAIMRTHTDIGARILDGIEGMQGARRIVAEHHERWDGSGYPRGLRGAEICIGARVLAVADAFDAIMSDRPYRPGATYEVARDEVIRCGGVYFDPAVVKTFVAVPKETWLELRHRYAALPRPSAPAAGIDPSTGQPIAAGRGPGGR